MRPPAAPDRAADGHAQPGVCPGSAAVMCGGLEISSGTARHGVFDIVSRRVAPRSTRRAGFGAGHRVPGGHRSRVTPVPIPNTEVKPATADGTAWETAWESRSLPGVFPRPDGRNDLGPFLWYAGSDLPSSTPLESSPPRKTRHWRVFIALSLAGERSTKCKAEPPAGSISQAREWKIAGFFLYRQRRPPPKFPTQLRLPAEAGLRRWVGCAF